MNHEQRIIMRKVYAIDNILENIQGVDFDSFKVTMLKNGEEVTSFELIETSKDQAYVGILRQLKNRIKVLIEEFKNA